MQQDETQWCTALPSSIAQEKLPGPGDPLFELAALQTALNKIPALLSALNHTEPQARFSVASSCIRGGLDQILGKITLLKEL